MTKPPIELDSFALDEFGRVVLSDDMIDKIECSDAIASAGANFSWCPGTSNGSCSNGSNCSYSSNSWCSNPSTCNNTSNSAWCT